MTFGKQGVYGTFYHDATSTSLSRLATNYFRKWRQKKVGMRRREVIVRAGGVLCTPLSHFFGWAERRIMPQQGDFLGFVGDELPDPFLPWEQRMGRKML